MPRKLFWFALTFFLAHFTLTESVFGASTRGGQAIASNAATVAANRLPLYFESNQGQTAGGVRFLARAGGYTAFLTGQDTVLLYHKGMPGQEHGRDAVVRMRLTGSRESSGIEGGERLPGVVNYLIGDDPSKWHTRIPTYSEVNRDQVYPGIDLTYRPDGKQLEFDFHVAPGTNPDPIRMIYSGASRMHLSAVGDLILDTEAGPVSILKPFAYQEIGSKRVPVAVSYGLLPDGEVGFQVGVYDHSRVLVIDPTVGPSVDYSTYLGSGSGDTFSSIAADAAGEAFITGSTYWNNYPTGALPGYSPYSSTFPQTYFDDGVTAGFVTALNAVGTGIIYSTYIAGNSATSTIGVALNGIAVDAAGFAFVGGQTDDSTFPKVKAFQSSIPSSRSGYGVALGVVFELSQHGDSLIYSSFLGGGDYDTISAVAVDSSDNAYITGTNTVQGGSLTTSGFPVTTGVIWGHYTQQNIGAGFNDAFAAKITPPSSGNAILAYSTVIGSTGSDTPFTYGSAIAVDSSGDAYITGSTNCNIGDHGGTITTNLNMTNVTRAQSEDVNNVWVLELNPAATAATYIAYLGGSTPGGTFSPDTSVAGIKVDSTGQAYVAGTTEANNFQTSSGAYQTTKQLAGISNAGTEQSDGFVTVIAAGGASFAYSTYLNGTTVSAAAISAGSYGSPTISGIALGTGGQFAVSGLATTTNFPTSGSPAGTPLLSAFPGCPGNCAASVAFITKFTTGGLVYSAFLGAGNEAGVNGIASNATDVYVMLGEPANGLNSCGAYDTDNSSGLKELVVRVLDSPAIATAVSVDSKTADVSSLPQTISLTSSISASSTVNGGTATYAVTNSSAAQIGSPVTSELVVNGLPPSLSFTLPANTPIGTYTITEHYCGAEGFLNSSAMGSLVVSSPAPATTTAVTSSLNPSVFGQSVTFTSTVSSANAAPTGSVQFEVDGVDLGGTVALSAASSTSKTATSQATTALTATGSPHTVQANYLNSDGNFSDSSGTLVGGQTVTLAGQATLTVTGVPVTAQSYGTTFTVGSGGGSGTGAVTFAATGSCSVSGTTVTITSGTGTCSVTATKAANSGYASATSAAATVSATTATQATLTVTGVPVTARTYGTTFTVSSSGGSGTGSVTFAATGSCSVSGAAVTITSGTGTCSVTATKAADANYANATSAAATVSATTATQATLTVTGVPVTAQSYGTAFTVGSSGGSGTGAVTFAATGSCSVSGTTVTITSGTGTCSVTATKAADANYSSASSAGATVSATMATQMALTVTGVPVTAQSYGTAFTVGSSGGSGTGAVTFAATGSCSVSGTTVTITSGTGTCSVTATKTADANYANATSAAATVSVIRATAPVSVWPTASAITYAQTLTSSLLSGGTASIAGSFAFTSPSTAPVAGTALQSVTFTPTDIADYAPATGTAIVTVNKATPTVSAWPIASSITYNQTLASSILSGGNASIGGTFSWTNPATAPGVGTFAEGVTFTPSNSTDYNTVAGTVTLTENKAAATVTLGNLSQAYSGSVLAVTATTDPTNLAVGFTYMQNGQPASPTNVGSYLVTATINNVNYSGTTTGTLTITQAAQIITFMPPPSPVLFGVAPIGLSATGGASGDAVIFSVVSGPGSVSGSTLTIIGAGTVVVAANQAGNANFSTAPQVTQSIVVTNISLTFNVGAMGFGGVPLGSASPDQTLILSNPSSSPVNVISILASGDFSAANNCPVIAAMSTCSINITFTPTATGVRAGTLAVTDAQSNNPQSIALTGTGTAPGILVVPALLNFGSQIVSTTSSGQAITIMNSGNTTLIISNIATSGDFVTSGNCASIPAGSDCSLTVTFTPTATGARTGTVTLTGNDGGGTQIQVINLSATGTLAGAALAPSVQTFPSTLVGASSPPLNVVLTNSGADAMTDIAVSTLGDFTQTNTCAAPLAPGASCTISIAYAPTIAGTESGELAVSSDLETLTVSLIGNGLATGASLDTTQLLYGGQLVGTSSLAQTVIFTNTGSIPINITSVAPSTDFTDTTNCSGSIAAGASCSINILFIPTSTGSLHGAVTIIDTAGTQVVTTQGQGASQGLAMSPSFITFGAQQDGSASQAQTLTLTNTGTTALTLSPVVVSTDLIQANQCPAILPAGASCTISLIFSPTAVGMLSGSVVASDDSGVVTALATVSGQSTLPGIAASPANLFFGSLPVGTASQGQTVTVTNTTSAPVGLGPVRSIGDFAETDTCAAQMIAAGSYCVISVTLTPTTTGTRTGGIQFSDSAGGMHQIALSGTGQEAGVSVFPTNLAFGSLPFVSAAQASTATGTPLSVTLTNTSGTALELGGYNIQGEFTESDSCGTTIAVGASCTLTLQFIPTGLGQRTGTLTITDGSGARRQSVSLQGYGSPAGLTLMPPVLDFGVTSIGQTSAAQTATLANNTGQAITDLAITSSGEYGESDNCGTALGNGATCTLHITVTPLITGAITGAISISSGGFAASGFQRAGIGAKESSNSSSTNVGVIAVLAYTTSQMNETAQLAFAEAPAPSVAAGGNAGSNITVQEDDSNGNAVNATDTLTISVAGPGGYSHTYTSAAFGGVATFNLGSVALTAVGDYTYTAKVASNPSIRPVTASVTVRAGGAKIGATSGGGQIAVIDQAFAIPLQVLVTDANSNPLSGVTVTYTIPTTGASVRLSSTSAVSGSDGTVSVTAIANDRAGSYTVMAALSGTTAAAFSLSNAKATPAIAWAKPTAIPYGTALSATQLNATSGGIAGSFVYTPAAGTVLIAGPQTLSVIFTPTDTADYNLASGTVVLAVGQVASAISVTSSSSESLLQNAVTLTATVAATGGTPTGTVSFLDGTTALGAGGLSAGMAIFTTSSLTAGSHIITAVYSGDTNDVGATSAALTQLVIDFSLKPGSGAVGPVQSALPGASATYTVTITPTAGTAFPVPAILTVTGLPAGTSAALSTPPWTRLTGTSWQLPTNTALTDVSLTFALPSQVAGSHGADAPADRFPRLLLGLLLLPFAGKLRRIGERMGRAIFWLWLLTAGAAAITGLSGCASGNGFFGQPQKTYSVTVTVTAGTLSHSTDLTLTVQ
jgi:hypothetical protein